VERIVMLKFGVDSFIWSENFTVKDLWIIPKAKELGFETIDIAIAHPETFPTAEVMAKVSDVGIEVVTTTTLNKDTNLISPEPKVRVAGVEMLKKLVNVNIELGSKILGGVNYAGWGCLTGKPRTDREWEWSVQAMREVAQYAQSKSDLIIALEPVNRFETHFLNIAEDAVRYCKEVGTGNIKVHLDSFHMIREETSFKGAVNTCGREYLGYVHVCESNRGIPGTGLVPWREFFTALKSIGYSGPLVIESFDPGFEELNRLCAIWRKFAESGEALAIEGLRNLKAIASEVEKAPERSDGERRKRHRP
jgi:D-psicose/D-tagatose/L-ribulose 3-epimerase